MTAGIKDLTGDAAIEAGDTYDIIIPLVDDQGVALVLTSYPTARMMLRENVDDTGAPLLSITEQTDTLAAEGQSGIVIDTGTNAGQIRITLSAADTETISFSAGVAHTTQRTGVYDLEVVKVVNLNPVVWKLLSGTYTVIPESTRP